MFLSQISSWTAPLTQVIAEDIGRIAWNTFLAIVPLTLSFFLFYQPRSRLFRLSTYTLLCLSFIIGIKKYNNGDFLQAITRFVLSLWGVRAIFIAISIGLIILLIIIDQRFRSLQYSASNSPLDAAIANAESLHSERLHQRNRSIFWWLGLCLFILILPNAPYILTDIIHFYDAVRTIDSAWTITLVIVPIYILFIGTGWFAYVFSLVNLRKYLTKCQLDRYTQLAEITIHLLCAIGIYIGRFIRLNSWDIVTQPKELLRILPEELIGKFPLVVIILTFSIIAVLYALCKPMVAKSFIYRAEGDFSRNR
jgi:uncharacterized membrane protein